MEQPISEPKTGVIRGRSSTGTSPEDWTSLVGQRVQIKDAKRIIDAGLVEAVTPDGSILWLEPEGAVMRRLIQKLPGIELCLINA